MYKFQSLFFPIRNFRRVEAVQTNDGGRGRRLYCATETRYTYIYRYFGLSPRVGIFSSHFGAIKLGMIHRERGRDFPGTIDCA